MDDTLQQVKNALENYEHALSIKNGNSAYQHMREIERNSVPWLRELSEEVEAQHRFGISADALKFLINCNDDVLPLVYVCSPLKGNVKENVAAARRYCAQVIKAGYIPIAPHVMFAEILDDDKEDERRLGMAIGNELLRFCRELWIFGPYISNGMRTEIRVAGGYKIPVIDKRETN